MIGELIEGRPCKPVGSFSLAATEPRRKGDSFSLPVVEEARGVEATEGTSLLEEEAEVEVIDGDTVLGGESSVVLSIIRELSILFRRARLFAFSPGSTEMMDVWDASNTGFGGEETDLERPWGVDAFSSLILLTARLTIFEIQGFFLDSTVDDVSTVSRDSTDSAIDCNDPFIMDAGTVTGAGWWIPFGWDAVESFDISAEDVLSGTFDRIFGTASVNTVIVARFSSSTGLYLNCTTVDGNQPDFVFERSSARHQPVS